MIKINEIFYSIQGESSYAGLPCIFVRLTYCNIRCSYCDTEYAFYEGKDFTVEQIFSEIEKYKCKLVEITGGEPLFQKESLTLMEMLCDKNYEVMLETGGSLSIENVDKRVKIILDFKCPSSKMEKKNYYENVNFLKPIDEVKFVIGDYEDFLWSKNLIEKFELNKKCEILFSPVFGKIEYKQLVEWILNENLNVRFQIQQHKHIWEPNKRGV
ncbi:MAG: radical SAM protein [Ignavibacteriales bacterium]|nr:radical SAM protein [Ignavibacteriales bacterium]